MRRTLLAVLSLGAVALVAAGLVPKPAASPAQPSKPGATDVTPAARPSSPLLPVTKIVLFTSGVGYFERRGEVEGDIRIDLTFRTHDINDLLKSMVVEDKQGRISAAGCDSQEPLAKALQSFAINLSGNPSFGQVLNQARGEKVEVVLQQSSTVQPGTVSGTVMGTEFQRLPAGNNFVEVEYLNLWCKDGLRSLKLADVQRLRFLNPVIDTEVQRALEVLAQGHDTQKKAVSLSFAGKGKRTVRVGYVVENPIWKTSYRLVLDKAAKPFVQGWAMVENPSDDDWNNVSMRLVSGRPISFRMDLYQPLYVHRPLVELEHFASLRPPVYEGEKMAPPGMPSGMIQRPGEEKEDRKYDKDKDAAPAAKNGEGLRTFGRPAREPDAPPMDLRGSAPAVAQATKLGDFFQYVIDDPVSLPRQKSALLPILNKEVEAAKVSIYNERTQAKHPLFGVKLKNTTGAHLMQGPITVFDEGSYAGDARILDVPPGDERLLSYAIDLGMEVKPEAKREPERLVLIKIKQGIADRTFKLRETKTYQISNRSEEDRTLILEHPMRAPDFKLIKPEKPTTEARDVYRFEVKVPKGKSTDFEIIEEREILRRTELTNFDDQTIRLLLENQVLGPKMKAALQKAQEMKAKLVATQRDLELLGRQVKEAATEQARLRENMKVVDKTDPAYKTFQMKLLNLETDLDNLHRQIKKQQEAEGQQRRAYDEYLGNLTVEE
jgi:hypothetical protein